MEKKSKKSIVIGISVLLLVTLTLLGLTYAYYRTRVIGNEKEASISVTSKLLEVRYQDGTSEVNMEGNIEPGFVFTKNFSIKNTGSEAVNYSIKFDNILNTFTRTKDWVYELYRGNKINEENLLKSGTLNKNNFMTILPNIKIEAGSNNVSSIDEYTLVLKYIKLDNEDQSEDMGKTLNLRINIDNELSLLSDLNTLQVGDYVKYEYNPSIYTTPEVSTGESVYTVTQSFDSSSNGNVPIEQWRVLKIENNEIELVADYEALSKENDAKIILYGKNGLINGNNVLNNLCETLYSGVYGTARSLNVEDVINLKQPTINIRYTNKAGKTVYIEEEKTIGALETQLNLQITNRITPNNEDLSDLIINYKYINLHKEDEATTPENSIIGSGRGLSTSSGNPYWLATNMNHLDFKSDLVKYRQSFIGSDGTDVAIMGRHLYNSAGEEQTDVLSAPYNIRPVVKLNNNIYVEKEQIENSWFLVN